tara:strand:- start:818 stop:1879 length:1062 start_codon:yes stop_codon:yes gene_type:complete
VYILEVESTPEYLVHQQVITEPSEVSVSLLDGGVSNRVLLVEFTDSARENWVLKQARDRLAVEQEWLCSVERVIREMDTLQICNDMIQLASVPLSGVPAVVPAIHFEDRNNYVYAMTAAAADCRVWKTDLLDGVVDSSVAQACGWLLGVLHAGSWMNGAVRNAIGSTEFFDDLRLDPYYRQIARVHSALQAPVDRLLELNGSHRHCLVHGDYSPKNILVNEQQVILLDFEVGHFGDPAFDLGFFLTHLHIKTLIAGSRVEEYASLIDRFWIAYQAQVSNVLSQQELVSLERRTCLNLGGCLVARVDGKSPVEYLVDESVKTVVRNVGWNILVSELETLAEVRELMHSELQKKQ